ncbi:PREDICTED: scavenger receptor class B member 1-like isoform X2 [Vollenhovia emeryi]|uniref:scavenger receptor class B member 1-like isoform X2 n=1 Tax=Vollenhovia emeryi TaxID=411798 RepID=UPI0005F4C74A|nr:PREDICTED: scavenger receptor class B member 1-like isoform X2 [Vollenhovia emeryi]XP_011870819.1 PREDICTED: scavenger receptor class B member 1-like isoform X2 [Vollenhovia emeryi]
MKSTFALEQFKKSIILFMVGVGCSSLMYTIYVIDPVTMLVEYNLEMLPHSWLFTLWKVPPVDMYLNVYVFNITNPIEFLNGEEKLKVQEIGPYVYQEFLVNDNVTFNDNGTMTYIPRRTIAYVPEMSVGDPSEDIINIPNLPFLGASSALSDSGFMVNYPFVQLTNLMKAKPILNMTVYDYFWGYEDSMVTLASGIVPKFVNFQKLGLLDRMYDEGENIITVYMDKQANIMEEKGRYLSIDRWNGSPGLANWGYVETEGNETRKENTVCNTLQGATEGTIFPPHIDKRAKFRVFRKSFCRALQITYRKEVWTKNGIPGYLYTLADDFADPPDLNPDNECYCRKMKTCLKKGLSDLSPCYYNIPAAVSLPHFLDADPSLLEDVEGLEPDREKHESYVILQPLIGIPLVFHSRVQTNLVMQRTRYNSKITAFNNITVPLIWIDMHILSLPTFMIVCLKLALQILPIAQTVVMYLLGVIGVTMSVLSLISIVWILNQQQQQEQEMVSSNDNPDLRIPLCNGQYTSIHILPTVNRIASKTDCLVDN